MHHANMKNISLKLFQNEHDSVKDARKKKAKKHVTSTQKIGPAKERKEWQEKRKKRGGDKAKSKSQHCCVVKVFCTKTLFCTKRRKNIYIFFII